MERFVKGDVLVVPFPFSDLTSNIKRPALVAANLKGEDIILCQISRKQRVDPHNIELSNEEFVQGNLKQNSFIRASRLFTLRKSLILYKLGKISEDKIRQVEDKLVEIFRN